MEPLPRLRVRFFAPLAAGALTAAGALFLWYPRAALPTTPRSAEDAAVAHEDGGDGGVGGDTATLDDRDALADLPIEAGGADAVPSACDLARAWNRRVLDDALAWARAHGEALGRPATPSARGRGAGVLAPGSEGAEPWVSCAADPEGAWAIVFDAAEYVPAGPSDEIPWVLNGEVVVARFDHDAGAARRKLTTYMMAGGDRGDGFERVKDPNCCASGMSDGYTLTPSFDVDHDGVPEAVVTSGMHPDNNDVRTVELLSARGGAITVLATGFDDVGDFDGDGEADLAYDLVVSHARARAI